MFLKQSIVNWLNFVLSKRKLKVDNFETSFSNGFLLKELLEILSKKQITQALNKKCAMRVQKISNVAISLDFMQNIERIKFVNITPESIVDGTIKFILALSWILIQHYVIDALDTDLDLEIDPEEKKEKPEEETKKPVNKQDKAKLALLNWLVKLVGDYKGVQIDKEKPLKNS